MNPRIKKLLPGAVLGTMLLASGPQASPSAGPAAPDRAPPIAGDAPGLVMKGEIAARSGHAREAWDLFGRALKADPGSEAAIRWICRLAITYGPRASAVAACRQAFERGQTPEDFRNRVAAWVGGSVPPTMEELLSASFIADGAVRLAPAAPWGYLARADIALRLRDRDLLDASLSDAARVAPKHELTSRMVAFVGARASAWVWAGRLAVLSLFVSTAAHALWRTRRRSGRAAVAWGVSAAIVLLLLGNGAAAAPDKDLAAPRAPKTAADPSGPPPLPVIDPAHPEDSLAKAEAQNSLAWGDALMAVVDRAIKATARGDHATAARYWTAVTKGTPHSAYGFARLCEAEEAAGHKDLAVGACRIAITREGSTRDDYTHFVRLLLAKNAPLSSDDRHQIDVAIGQLEKSPDAVADAAQLRCELAMRVTDLPALRACTRTLAADAPDAPDTIFYQWTLAVEAKDRRGAERLLERAHEKIVNEPLLARMDRLTLSLPRTRLARGVRWGAAASVVLLSGMLLYAAGRLLFAGIRRRFASSSPSEVESRKELERVY